MRCKAKIKYNWNKVSLNEEGRAVRYYLVNIGVIINKLEVNVCFRSQKRLSNQIMRSLYQQIDLVYFYLSILCNT